MIKIMEIIIEIMIIIKFLLFKVIKKKMRKMLIILKIFIKKKILDKFINKKYSKNNQIIINNLKKHNSSISNYNKEKITSLIFDGKFHYVSIFKDYLFWDDEVECLKKYYKKEEIIPIMNKFINYYCTVYNSLNIYCIYFHLGEFDLKEFIDKFPKFISLL